jgi:hypothetical protein
VTGPELQKESEGIPGVDLAKEYPPQGVHPSTITRIHQAAAVSSDTVSRYRTAVRRCQEKRQANRQSAVVAASALRTAAESLLDAALVLEGVAGA